MNNKVLPDPPAVRRRWLCCFAIPCLLWAGLVLAAPAVAAASVVVAFDSRMPTSVVDQRGVMQALHEAQIEATLVDISAVPFDSGLLARRHIVVLCDLTLSAVQAGVLEQWVHDGGGLLASGAAGVGLEALTGTGALAPLAIDLTEVTMPAAHPVAHGTHWQGPITQTPPMPAAEIPSTVQLLYINRAWPAWGASGGDGTMIGHWDGDDGTAAIVAAERGAGRVVWSGALPGAYSDWDWPHSWRTVVVAAVQWLRGSGVHAELGYWPHAHRAAMVFTADTESTRMGVAVPALLDIFAEFGLQRFGTFFMLGRADGDDPVFDYGGALEHPEVVRAIIAAGAEVAGHGDVHRRFNGQSLAVQRARLQAMLDIIEPILAESGDALLGFRAPYLSGDLTTSPALADVGIAYDSSDADVWSETTLPFFDGHIYQLPPGTPMDWHLLEVYGLDDTTVTTLFVDKIDYVMSRRGMFAWLTHPWVIEPHLDIVRGVLAAATAHDDLWLTRMDDIAVWWAQREELRLAWQSDEQTAKRLRLHNPGAAAIDGASVWLRLPTAPGTWQASIDGEPVPMHERVHGGVPFLVAVVPRLEAGAQVDIELDRQRPARVFADGFEGG
jgi:hypothetical protein